jgi:hypothetical protein
VSAPLAAFDSSHRIVPAPTLRFEVRPMAAIDYDPSREALYRPASRPTVLVAGRLYSNDALCAEFARLAYLHFESDDAQRERLIGALARVGFRNWAGFRHSATGSEAFAAIDAGNGAPIVVFRGTEPGDLADLATDLDARPARWEGGGSVHLGFAQAFAGLRGPIEDWLHASTADGSSLTLAGHSLGAALATLAMSAWRGARLVTFGSPRVGDAQFVATLDAAACRRYVGCCDIVCRVPPSGPWYADAGAMHYIDRAGVVHEVIDDSAVSADRDRARLDYLRRYAGVRGNVLVRDFADHAPINYVRALLPPDAER